MYIKELTVSYFKSIGNNLEALNFGIPNGQAGSGLNIFLGENNTGKSTIFEAFDFLRNKSKKPRTSIVNQRHSNEEASVNIVFTQGIEEVIEQFSPDSKKKAFRDRIYHVDEQSCIRLQRTTRDKTPLTLWNPENGEYENVSGIDAPIQGMFETNFVWADTNPNEEAKFGASTICGSLIGQILNSFTDHEEYANFISQYDRTFNSEESNLKRELRDIEERTQEIFQNQFGNGNIRFQFEQISPSNFFKNVKVYIDDGTETTMDEKGSGMQRAVALAMVQVYADIIRSQPDRGIDKPLFLFIDEPEVCLHPKAQERLFTALLELSKSNQIFITTHSPYFLSSQHMRNMNLFVCISGDHGPVISNLTSDGLFPWSPTWGEINYMAYDMPTIDLHNELYGRLQEITGHWNISHFDNHLEAEGLMKGKQWREERGGIPRDPYDVTLMTFIRHKIHHPENATMQADSYTTAELSQSIESMIQVLNRMQ